MSTKERLKIDNNTRIKNAIVLLGKNGYVIKKITKNIELDMDRCERSNGDKECLDCACNICLMQ